MGEVRGELRKVSGRQAGGVESSIVVVIAVRPTASSSYSTTVGEVVLSSSTDQKTDEAPDPFAAAFRRPFGPADAGPLTGVPPTGVPPTVPRRPDPLEATKPEAPRRRRRARGGRWPGEVASRTTRVSSRRGGGLVSPTTARAAGSSSNLRRLREQGEAELAARALDGRRGAHLRGRHPRRTYPSSRAAARSWYRRRCSRLLLVRMHLDVDSGTWCATRPASPASWSGAMRPPVAA